MPGLCPASCSTHTGCNRTSCHVLVMTRDATKELSSLLTAMLLGRTEPALPFGTLLACLGNQPCALTLLASSGPAKVAVPLDLTQDPPGTQPHPSIFLPWPPNMRGAPFLPYSPSASLSWKHHVETAHVISQQVLKST